MLIKYGEVSAQYLVNTIPINPNGLRGRISELRKEYADVLTIETVGKIYYKISYKRKSRLQKLFNL